MKSQFPDINTIFNDLDTWRNHCRFNGVKFDEADLYKSASWKDWNAGGSGRAPRPANHSSTGKKPYRNN